MHQPNSTGREFPQDIFESLLGGTYDFYGVDGNTFCIGVGESRLVLEAEVDPSDGYRSYFGCFNTGAPSSSSIFFGTPVARVELLTGGRSSRIRCFCGDNDPYDAAKVDSPCDTHRAEQERSFKGWQLRDVDTGHVWLTVGTDYGEDYYPCFTFDYQPDKNQKVQISG